MPVMESTANGRFRPAPHVLHQEVNGEVVLLDLDGEVYLGLNELAGRIWQRLLEGETAPDIVAVLEQRYDATRATLEADVSRLIGELLDQGLIEPFESA